MCTVDRCASASAAVAFLTRRTKERSTRANAERKGEGEMKKRVLVLLTALIMALTMSVGPALAGGKDGGGGGNDGKKRVCVKHFTSSAVNPYNYLWLPLNAAQNHGVQHGDEIIRYVASRVECKALEDTP